MMHQFAAGAALDPMVAGSAVVTPAEMIERAAALGDLFARTAAEHDRAGSIPTDNFAQLHAAGMLGLSVPGAWGGLADSPGLGLATATELVREVARGEPATALIFAMQLIQHAVLAHGQLGAHPWPDAVYGRVAREAVTDGALINTLRAEPALGTPARGGLPETIGRRVAQGWRISGHKIFCTGIPVLRWLIVWGRTDEATPRIGNFLVPQDAPGLRVVPTWDHLGLRASASHDVIFDNVLIPAEYGVDLRLPAAWPAGPDPVHQAWNAALLGALYLGVAEAAADWLAGYLHARVPSNLGAALASLPRMQAEMGEIAASLRIGRRLLRSLAVAQDAGQDAAQDAPGDEAHPADRVLNVVESQVVKQRVTADAIAAVQRAVALIGNAGLTRAHPLERHLRDVLCGRIHTPQDDSVFAAAGRAALQRAAPSGGAAA